MLRKYVGPAEGTTQDTGYTERKAGFYYSLQSTLQTQPKVDDYAYKPRVYRMAIETSPLSLSYSAYGYAGQVKSAKS